MKASPINNVTTLGIDLAKNIFQLHGVDSKGTKKAKTTPIQIFS